ncbi:MAG: 3-keto-disaccharide hydrolase [Opitutaceae bacterium]
MLTLVTFLPPAVARAGDAPPAWENLFDGKSLTGWAQSGFEGEADVKVINPFKDGRGAIILEQGVTLSGITWTRGARLPRLNYELTLEAMKLAGTDFFCGLTFPVGKSACSFIVGGWGGMVVGISSIDHADASENDTTQGMEFELNRWYRIRVRVTEEKIEAWIDDDQKVDVETKGRIIGIRPGDIQKSLPLGIASYMTRAAVRDIRLRRL